MLGGYVLVYVGEEGQSHPSEAILTAAIKIFLKFNLVLIKKI